MHLTREERVGGADHGADVEIVVPVLDRDVERVTALIEVRDDCLERPIPVAVHDVATVPVREQLAVEARVVRPLALPRAQPVVRREVAGIVGHRDARLHAATALVCREVSSTEPA